MTLKAVLKFMLKFEILGLAYLECLPFPSPEHGIWNNTFNSIRDISFGFIGIHIEALRGEKETFRKMQDAGFFNPS